LTRLSPLPGVVAPAVVLAAALPVALLLGPWWGFGVVAAGLFAIIVHHLWHLGKLAAWATADIDAPVPHGRGAWEAVFTGLHRRVRLRAARQRDLSVVLERFRLAAEAVPDGMVVIDQEGRIRWANRRAIAHLGLDLERDRGQPLTNLARQPAFIEYLGGTDFSHPIVVESQRSPGATLEIQVVPFGTEERLVVSRDVSRIEAVARMRRDFIANISHELKTPLTVVSGFVETLQDLELEPRQRERYLRLMQDQARNMHRLVDDLLTLSALESEQTAPPETALPLAPLLLERTADARALSSGRHAIDVDLADAAAVSLRGARDELASAVGNLLSNAIRYTAPGGAVRLSWRAAADGTGAIVVSDNGIGIAAEHLPRLTERFYRVDRSRSRATGGTGLGLAIVKHVLLRHQCELEIASEPGKGSEFRIRIPAARLIRTPGSPPDSDPQTGPADSSGNRSPAATTYAGS
jgi:two-component system phosphate regulon sensor histidine kinase PhoR